MSRFGFEFSAPAHPPGLGCEVRTPLRSPPVRSYAD